MHDLVLPLTQSEAFERTCKAVGLSVQRYSDPSGTCLVQARKFPIIGQMHLVSRGPVHSGVGEATDLLSQVRQSVRGPLFVNPPTGYRPHQGWKVAGQATLAIVDLEAPELMRRRLNQKWRNQLKKSEQSPLRVIDQPLDARRHKWFLDAEQMQQKQRRYKTYPTGFLLAYAASNPGQARLYTAMQGTDPVAAMLVLKHGRMATYQAGIILPDGRAHCAHNLLLWSIMRDLHSKGVQQLDLGRSDLSDGLRRFKLGSGAREEQLPGTFWAHGAWFGRSILHETQRETASVAKI